jgi:AhpD family alkylhydroperoxidase
MLPSKLRYWLFDTLSVQTMRYVSAIPTRDAYGLTKTVYDMIREDFFKNGSLTSRSSVPELMAAIWTAGRESMLVPDKVDRTTKDAISAVLSQMNDCPYCEDMLISLVHAGGEHQAATEIFSGSAFDAPEDQLRRRLEWVRALATSCGGNLPPTPFSEEQIPEVIGTLLGMSDINRFSHVVMSDSPVSAPFGLQSLKAMALKLFGSELTVTRQAKLLPGRTLDLLPSADLPDDMAWARPNPRVANALARYANVVEVEGEKVISTQARNVIRASLDEWNGEQMPLDSEWFNRPVALLTGEDRATARLAIVVGKASYRVTEQMVTDVLGCEADQERFVRILAWSTSMAARRFAQIVASRIEAPALKAVAA